MEEFAISENDVTLSSHRRPLSNAESPVILGRKRKSFPASELVLSLRHIYIHVYNYTGNNLTYYPLRRVNASCRQTFRASRIKKGRVRGVRSIRRRARRENHSIPSTAGVEPRPNVQSRSFT